MYLVKHLSPDIGDLFFGGKRLGALLRYRFVRRLALEGDSYLRLVEQARFETAAQRLRDDRAKLIDIAYDLGYTDAANFTRAFRRWTGMGPRAFRRTQT